MHRTAEAYLDLSRRILRSAISGSPRDQFSRTALEHILQLARCELAELRVVEGARYYRARLGRTGEFLLSVAPRPSDPVAMPVEPDDSQWLADRCANAIRLHLDHAMLYTEADDVGRAGPRTSAFRSLVLVPLAAGEDSRGLLMLRSREVEHFRHSEMQFYEGVGQLLGAALAGRRAQVALRERVKELTCLYGIAKVVEEPGLDVDTALDRIAALLPPAWLHSDIASACIELDGRQHWMGPGREGPHRQQAVVTVHGRVRGFVEVVYSQTRPFLDEGPFLLEERKLIDAVAREVSLFVERQEAVRETARLGEQLRHADRLATIGQLAAGVAHEVNEPLGIILGFAQLAQKAPGLPGQAATDIGHVVQSALHAREVVSKLMLFARQKPPTKSRVDLNELVTDGLYILGARCSKAGIELVRELAPALPTITADAAQLNQVLVNLVVNAIQALPSGGRIVIRTDCRGSSVVLTVEDNGTGMTSEVMDRVFEPFFTTKPVGEGTGLGLSVVHGIVTGHGGSISVWSEPGRGTRFEVVLPADGRGGPDDRTR